MLFISFLLELDFINSFLALSKVLANTFCILQEKNVQTIVEMGRCQYSFSPTDREQIDSAEAFLEKLLKKSLPELLHRLMSYRWWHVGVARIEGTDGP